MGWKQYVRSANAAARRSEREAVRRHRELQKHYDRQMKASQRQQAADEVNEFENYLAVLVSVHADCGDVWDWQKISTTPPPREPTPPGADSREAFARVALQSYQPGFFDRLFGGAKKTIAQLESAVQEAAIADRHDYGLAMASHREAVDRWNANLRLAPAVMRLHLEACRAALEHAGAFEELRAFKTNVYLQGINPQGAALICRVEDSEIVPTEELKLTAGGKVSTKEMALAKYWAIYKDHVCSCALRVARETFAVLPIPSVTINVEVVRLDPSSGHVGPATILAARLTREALARLNFETINPSASLASLPHRMSFKKTSGFQTIEPFDDAEVETAAVETPSAAARQRFVAIEEDEPSSIPDASIAEVTSGPFDQIEDEALGLEEEFVAWLTAHFAGRDGANFKIKTLVNQLGRYRADRRLSLKAVQDLAEVLDIAGYEVEPDLRDAVRSPGIDARIRVSRRLSVEERSAAAYQEAAGRVALSRFLWGAGFRKLSLSADPSTRLDELSVDSVPDLLSHMRGDAPGVLEVLEELIVTSALEHWLSEAHHESRLAALASAIRCDTMPDKAERWLTIATRG